MARKLIIAAASAAVLALSATALAQRLAAPPMKPKRC